MNFVVRGGNNNKHQLNSCQFAYFPFIFFHVTFILIIRREQRLSPWVFVSGHHRYPYSV